MSIANDDLYVYPKIRMISVQIRIKMLVVHVSKNALCLKFRWSGQKFEPVPNDLKTAPGKPSFFAVDQSAFKSLSGSIPCSYPVYFSKQISARLSCSHCGGPTQKKRFLRNTEAT